MEKQIKLWGALLLGLLSALLLLSSPAEGYRCHVNSADVTVLVDSSGSIGTLNQPHLKKFLEDLTEGVYAKLTEYRLALTVYDDKVKHVLPFSPDIGKIREAVKHLPYLGGGTGTGIAIQDAAENIRKNGRLYKTQLCMIVTDGCTNVGPSVSSVIDDLKRVCDRIIVVGVSKSVKFRELRLMAKNSKILWSRNFAGLQALIPRILYQICRIVHKVCPTPRHLSARCVNNMREYRTIMFYPWNGECWKKVRVRYVTVKCHHKFKPHYSCKGCKRYWILKYKLVRKCKCIMKTHIFHAGRCCCPRSTKSVNCKKTYKKTVYTRYDLINGKCWRRRMCKILRCGCPRGRSKVWCVMNRYIVRWSVHYKLIRGSKCKKIVVKRRSPVVCRHVKILAKSKRCFRLYDNSKYSNQRYLKITLQYFVRDGCQCKKRLKNIIEPCSCFKRRRWIWLRHCDHTCREDCHKSCHSVKVWLTYKFAKHQQGSRPRCISKPLFKQHHKCCCRKHRPHTRRRCKNGHIVSWACFYKLYNGLCHKICRWTAIKVHCRHGILKRQIRRLSDGRYRITQWLLIKRHCRCITKRIVKYIPNTCGKPGHSYRKCRSGLLYLKAKYRILVGFRCIIRVILIRIKVDCPHYTIFIRRRCDPSTRHFVLLYKKASQNGCKCTIKYIRKRGLPCYCRKRTITPWRCVNDNMYRRIIVSYRLFQGRCIRTRRVMTRMITTCHHRIWFVFKCFKKTGIRLVYRLKRYLVRCRCVIKRKLVKKDRCNCIAVNRKNSHVRRIFCDRKKNQLVTQRWIYIFDPRKHCCIRKTSEKRKTISCSPKIINHRGRCNIHTWKRTLTRVFYKIVNCACKRILVHKQVSCKCNRPKSTTRCEGETGVLETTTCVEKFSLSADRCIKVIRVIRRSSGCTRSVRILRTRCNGRTYTETILRTFRRSGTCQCAERVTRATRPCACPTKIKTTPCRRYLKHVIIRFYKWNEEKKECVRSHKISYALRCRCPSPKRIIKCSKGQKIVTTITYTLLYYTCIQRTQITRNPIQCSRRLRYKRSRCYRCKSTLFTLAHLPHPNRCHCRWRRIFSRRCRCCPCPRSRIRVVCVGFAWKVIRVSWKPVYVRNCRITCIPIIFVYYRPIVCPTQPQPQWTKCEKCKEHWTYYAPVINKCKCKYRQVVTAKTRNCCCNKPPEKTVKCIKGDEVTTVKNYVLEREQCVENKTVTTRQINCATNEKLVRGGCVRSACLRPVFLEKAQQDRASCTCKQRRRKLYDELCCCTRAVITRNICLGQCTMTSRTITEFDESQRRCIEKTTKATKCIKCENPPIVKGPCRSSCFRYVYTKVAQAVDCQCRVRTTRSVERCCCRRPTRRLKSCVGNTIVLTRQKFVLNGDNCTSVTQKKQSIVPCRVGVVIRTRVGKCNSRSCKKLVAKTYEKRSGCTCVSYKKKKLVTCCCPSDRSRLVCVKNTNVVRVTVSYRLINHHCMPSVTRTTIRQIPRCRSTLTSTKCNRLTKRRWWFKTYYKVVKCRCVKSYVKRRSYPCACRKPHTSYKRCHRRSCRQRVCRIWYILVNYKRCVRKKKVWFRPCCCKRKKWSFKRCNRHTGQVELHRFRRVFHWKLHRCLTFSTVVSLGISINCFYTVPRIRPGVCNFHTGFARDSIITYHLRRRRCQCVRRIRFRSRACSCKHLRCKTLVQCKNGFTVKKKTCWKLLAGSCHPITFITHTPVICKRNRRCLKVCDQKGCGGTLRCQETRRVKCACRRFTHARIILCCCPRLQRKVRCENPFIVEYLIGYTLNSSQDKCRRYVTRKRTALKSCPRKSRIIKRKCNTITCNRLICVVTFGIRNCRCIIIRKKYFVRKCCCPPRKTSVTCGIKTGIVTHYTKYYTLSNGVCLKHQRITQTETRCDSVIIKVRPCNHRTKKRIVILTTFMRRDCHCQHYTKRIVQQCHCRPPVIHRPAFKSAHKMRPVIYVYWELINIAGHQVCARRTHTLFHEPCVCTKPKKRVTCENSTFVKTRITQKMIHRFGQRLCISFIRRTRHIIKCSRKQVTRSKCRNNVRTICIKEWRLYNCRCQRFVRTRKEACDCHTKNSIKRFCKFGVKFVVTLNWITKPGFKLCHLTRITTSHPVYCPKCRIIPLTRSCPIKKGHGYYRKYVVICYVKHACRCRQHKKYILRLCRCRRKHIQKYCTGSAIVIKKFSYFPKYNWCFRQVHTVYNQIRCLLPRASLRASACRRVTRGGLCKRSITVTERRVRKCVCKSNLRNFSQICCAPRATRRKYCDKIRGYHVTVRHICYMKTVGLLYNQDGVYLRRRVIKCRKIATRRRVVCPASRRKVTCDQRTGVKKIIWVTIKRDSCKCVKKIKVTTGKCRCPAPRKIRHACRSYTRRVTYVYYVFRNNECKRRVIRRRERCKCPKRKSWTFCRHTTGARITCVVTYRLNNKRRPRCIRLKRCNGRRLKCPPTVTTRSNCKRKTGTRIVCTTYYTHNKYRCRCEKHVKKRTEICSCHHLNRKVKRCNDGYFEHIKKTFVLSNGRCVMRLTRDLKQVVCPRSTTTILNDCAKVGPRAGRRTKVTKYYVVNRAKCRCDARRRKRLIPCICRLIPGCKPKITRRCVRNVYIIRTFYCVLIREKCMKRMKEVHQTIPSGEVKKVVGKCKRTKLGAYVRTITYFKKVLKHCHPAWIIVGTKKQVCRCPPKRVIKKCYRDWQISIIIIRFFPHKSRTHCRSKIIYMTLFLRCHRSYLRRHHCNRRTCQRRVTKCYYRASHCKCRKYTRHFFRRCCCRGPTRRKTRCAVDGRTLVTRWATFKLSYGKCFPVFHVTSKRIQCETKPAVVKVERKCKRNTRRVTTMTYLTKRCACVPKTRITHIRCDCPARRLKVRGNCVGRQAIDLLYCLKYNPKTKFCVWKLCQKVKRVCRCPDDKRIKKCVNDDTFEEHTILFYFKPRANTCVKKVTKCRYPIGRCSQKRRLVRIQFGLCLKNNNYIQTDLFFYVKAENCKCKISREVRKWPCNCRMANKPIQQVRCERNNIKVITDIVQENKERKCVTKKFIRRVRVVCGNWRKTRSCSSPGSLRGESVERELRTVNCNCVLRIVRRTPIDCRCPPKKQPSNTCVNNKVRRSVVTNQRYNGVDKCYLNIIIRTTPVGCQVGNFETRSNCNSNGRFTIKKTTRTLKNCQCLERVASRSCKCRCPKPIRRLRCWRRRHIWCEINIVHVLKNCKCITMKRIRKWRLPCVSSRTTYSTCRPQSGGDGYRWYRKVFARRINCRCRWRVRRWRRLCSCAPRIRRIVKCRGKAKIIILTKRVFYRGKCRRVKYRRLIVRLTCGRPIRKVICKKGIQTVIHRRRYLVKCQCREQTTVKHSRCKCDSRDRLIRISICKKCRRTFIYSRQILVNGACVPKRRLRFEACCCRRGIISKTRKCNKHNGMIYVRTTKFVLRKGKCVLRTMVRKIIIICMRLVSAKVIHEKSGLIYSVKVYYVLIKHKCACARRVKKICIGRWKCPNPYVRIRCLNHRIWERTRVSFKLMKKTCVRIKNVKRIPVLCPFMVKTYRPCRRVPYGWARTIVRCWYVRRRCKCIKRIHITYILCRCWRRRIRRVCNRRTGVVCFFKEHFVPATNQRRCRCVRRSFCRSTRCDSRWRVVERLKCAIIYRRCRRIGCKCKTEKRRTSIRIKCPRRKVERGPCDKNVCRRTTKYTVYRAGRCQCIPRVYYKTKRCNHRRCPAPLVIKGTCQGGLRQDTVVYYKRVRCTCQKFTRIVRRRPKCRVVHKYAIGPCIEESQKFLIVRYRRRGCRCYPIRRVREKFCSCKLKQTEVIFVIASGRSGHRQFKAAISRYLKALISMEPIGNQYIRVAIVRSCYRPIVLNLSQNHRHLSKTVVKFLRRISFRCQSVHLGKALRAVRKYVLPQAREDANKLVVIISQSQPPFADLHLASHEAETLKSKGVTIKSIGINPGHEKADQLKSFASKPHYKNYAQTKNKSRLLYFIDFVHSKLCPPADDEE